eukprot:gene10572-12508_t
MELCAALSVSAKVAELVRLIQEMRDTVADAKALVFSQFPKALDAVNAGLRAASLETLRGPAAAAEFAEASGCSALLLDLRAASVGLNLVAASHVFFLEPSTNPTLEAQAASRCHRLGQTLPVYVIRLVYEGTLEQRILTHVQETAIGSKERATSEHSDRMHLMHKLFG